MNSKSNIVSILCLALHVSLVFAFKKVNAQAECDLQSICNSKSPGAKVINPQDCHSYYVCITNPEGDIVPSSLPIDCENGTYFDTVSESCQVEEFLCSDPCVNYDCYHTCDAVEIGYAASPSNCSSYYVCLPDAPPAITHCTHSPFLYFNGTGCSDDASSCCNICTPYCAEANTEVYDPYDCHSYYLCLTDNYTPSTESHFTCPDGLKFDEFTSQCVEDTESCESICT